MARERRRLLIPPARLAPRFALLPPERHYLTRVLRLAPGQGCDVVDGVGHRWGAVLTAAGELALEQPLETPLETGPAPTPTLELAVALPRQEVELVWRMATELGIDRLQPLLAERCQGRERWPLERWRAIVREACEQSERLWMPELAEPRTAAAWLARPEGEAPEGLASAGRAHGTIAPGELAQGQRAAGVLAVGELAAGELEPLERSPVEGLHLLATSRGEDRPLLQRRLAELFPSGSAMASGDSPAQAECGKAARVRLAIGPEGGWSPAEEALALGRGWVAVSAGPTILRTTTAAVAAAAWLTGWRASLSSSSSPWPSP
ncbi:MAG: 16S rRNA (uracil(1498)-N(3))-methyltransferase [Cyanobacteria bacterium K_Offshore_surface_m2_239]|nr:16S rRNA (uracil(1498)-N(3))-methyltransferase [Cyanobacteria bacterium K_Offshore_surface_m2_239]